MPLAFTGKHTPRFRLKPWTWAPYVLGQEGSEVKA